VLNIRPAVPPNSAYSALLTNFLYGNPIASVATVVQAHVILGDAMKLLHRSLCQHYVSAVYTVLQVEHMGG
jgi:hypothetical protein